MDIYYICLKEIHFMKRLLEGTYRRDTLVV